MAMSEWDKAYARQCDLFEDRYHACANTVMSALIAKMSDEDFRADDWHEVVVEHAYKVAKYARPNLQR